MAEYVLQKVKKDGKEEEEGELKNIDLRYNRLGDEGKGVIRDAVSGREGFKLKM